MRIRRSWKIFLSFGVFVLIAYAFLAGPLFAWSPVKPGYDVLHLERADIYFPRGRELQPAYRSIDDFIVATEAFHQMKFGRRMTVIVCESWSDFHRFLPTVAGNGVGAATPEFGTVTYTTPKIQEMNFDAGEFLRHEFSHAVLLQNSSLWKAIRFKQHPWLLEGLGVLAGDQRAYGTRADLVDWAREKSLLPLFAPQPYSRPGFNVRIAYLAWRYFLESTINTRGRAAFQNLLTAFIEEPTQILPAFKSIYGEDLTTAVSRFQSSLRDE